MGITELQSTNHLGGSSWDYADRNPKVKPASNKKLFVWNWERYAPSCPLSRLNCHQQNA